MVELCPRCRVRFTRSLHSGDYVHACCSDTTRSQEDIQVVGNWVDYTGSGGASKGQVMFQGIDNDLQNTEAGMEGAKFSPVTERGANASTTRQRQHLEYIPPKEEYRG